MNRTHHSPEFQEQALSKLRQRGTRTVRDVAEELNMSAGTLRKWWNHSNRSVARLTTPVAELPGDLAAEAWSPAQRLLALQHTHALTGAELHA